MADKPVESKGRGRGRGSKITVQAVGTPGPSNRQLGSASTPLNTTPSLGTNEYARIPPNQNKTKFLPNAKRKGKIPEIEVLVKEVGILSSLSSEENQNSAFSFYYDRRKERSRRDRREERAEGELQSS